MFYLSCTTNPLNKTRNCRKKYHIDIIESKDNMCNSLTSASSKHKAQHDKDENSYTKVTHITQMNAASCKLLHICLMFPCLGK